MPGQALGPISQVALPVQACVPSDPFPISSQVVVVMIEEEAEEEEVLLRSTHHSQPGFAAHAAWQAAVVVIAPGALPSTAPPAAGSRPETKHSHSRPKWQYGEPPFALKLPVQC